MRLIPTRYATPDAVRHAIGGQDVVLCALGLPLMNASGLRAAGTRNIVRAMEKIGVGRLVCLSSLGVGDSWDLLPFRYKYVIAPLAMRRLFADHRHQEDWVKSSRLDWVLVRPGSFSSGGGTGAYRHGVGAPESPLKARISPGDVADFMLKQLVDDTYIQHTLYLSY